ncbi:MAG: ribosome small subunit-dependent GTPase A [Gammaproteobacteria bacterium]|nr:ribosome small subunit-dependent GTPase A [Gammaproteobacteria bacterium]
MIASFGKTALVEDTQGHSCLCAIRRKITRPVSGDSVHWLSTGDRQGVIVAVGPRTNVLGRPDRRGRTRVIAANLDRLVIVVASEPAIQEILIDRYLIAAAYFDISPFILLNKTDLLSEEDNYTLEKRLSLYTQLGYPLIRSSIKPANGLDQLIEVLHHGSSMLVGQSGVGKSSLIRHLVSNAEIAVTPINRVTGFGRHTTSATTLYHLPGKGNIIDSPGVRDFGLWHIPEDRIAPGFIEFRKHLTQCRFRNCSHGDEPGCAVKAAVDSGGISPQRFANYHAIMNSLRQ